MWKPEKVLFESDLSTLEYLIVYVMEFNIKYKGV